MSGHERAAVAALALLGVLGGVLLVIVAAGSCPAELPRQPCPDAGLHQAVVVGLASVSAFLVVTPFALLAEFVARRRILYRGVWLRAGRRGMLVAVLLAAMAGLRLAGALTLPTALFTVLLGAAVEWFSVRRARG